MNQLPVVHMTLYKHGVGYYRRRGAIDGAAISLTFRREEMDDLLKSLTVIDYAGGQIQGVDYDTPQSQDERLTGCSVILDDVRSLRDLLMALRGRAVQLQVSDGSQLEGQLLGLDEADKRPLVRSLVSILKHDTAQVATFPLSRIEGLELLDDTSAADLRFFLQTALGQETHRSITIRLSPGSHDLEVSYIAPAPTWRVSYRLVVDNPETEGTSPEALLQGWGIFDNRLEEDLTDISLSLTAGMPISFVYDLYTPHTPERPVVEDEDRTAAAPIMFEASAPEADMADFKGTGGAPPPAPKRARSRAMPASSGKLSAATMADSVESAATGEALGELFQYNVSAPVTVGRGHSAMVPIVSNKLGPKKDLIYNGSKMATHPVATLRFKNGTGLTLERGPVTVLENGEYVGEAVLPFTADKAEAVISYAVELGIHIKESVRHSSELHSLSIKDGYLIQQKYDIRQTEYRVDNRTPQVKAVLIEHTSHHYKVFETPKALEKTLDTSRYKVEAASGKITTFVVKERHLQAHREALRNQTYKGLQQYFEGKFLDKRTYQSLKVLLGVIDEITQLERAIKQQEQRRVKIYKAQEQIQKNMVVLAKDGEEGRLRGRYVKQLTQSEEELLDVEQIIKQTQSTIDEKQAEIKKMIAALG